MRTIIAASLIVTSNQSPIAQALSLEFVADVSYNPRTNQYRIDLVEPYRSELPKAQNFLLLDVADFTVDKLLDAFEHNVLLVYERKCEAVRETLLRVRQALTSAHSGQQAIAKNDRGYTVLRWGAGKLGERSSPTSIYGLMEHHF